MKKIVYVIIFALILGLFSFGLAFAQTAKGQLEAIKEGIPTSWWDGGWDKLSELQSFISEHRDESILCAEAQFYIACCYYGSGSYQEAIDAYQEILTSYPTVLSECYKAQFEIGQIYLHRLKDIPQAISAYRKVVAEYAEGFTAASAQVCLGKCYQYQKDYATALLEYQKVLNDYPEAQTQHIEALLAIGDMCIRESLSMKYEKDKKAKIGEALSAYKETYSACPIEKPRLTQCIINKIYGAFKELDMSMVRANQFIKYQKYGPAGEDGMSGTPDDLTDPLAEF